MDRQPVPVAQPDRLRKSANWSGAKGWGLAVCFWIVIVLLSSLKREGQVIRGPGIPWIDSLMISIEVWGAWALLTPVIIWTDRHLPVRRDALLQRLLLHIPLSFAFITAYTYTARALTIPANGAVMRVFASIFSADACCAWAVANCARAAVTCARDCSSARSAIAPALRSASFRSCSCCATVRFACAVVTVDRAESA